MYHDGRLGRTGHVRVFIIRNPSSVTSEWDQVGQSMEGKDVVGLFGFSTSIPDTGEIVASSSLLHSEGLLNDVIRYLVTGGQTFLL